MSVELPASEALLARFLVYSEAGLRRVSFEIHGEQVSAFLRHGKLSAICTCGVEACEHQQIAWGFLGAEASPGPSAVSDARVRSSLRPPPPALQDLSPLADALDELGLAAARVGFSAPESLAIREALEQVTQRAPAPLSPAIARWVGRFNQLVAVGEVGLVAQLLDGARRFADELRAQDRSAPALARRRAWLGLAEGTSSETLSDSVLIEIGRERLAGISRNALDRRYLVDLLSGELFREERRQGDPDMSVGPCPRVVQLAFAELDPALRPRRLKLLQYTVSPEPSQAQWSRMAELAEREVNELANRYAEAARACPGLAEPVVLFAPALFEPGPEAALRDRQAKRLLLLDDAQVPQAEAVRAVVQEGEIVWLSGRLLPFARGLALRPISALVKQEGRLALRRIT